MSLREMSQNDDAIASQASEARAVLAGRIDFLYRLGRFYLFFPFAALGMAVTLFGSSRPQWVSAIPLLLMIGATVAGFRLTRAYEARAQGDDPHLWARRYTILSGVSGAFWGVGAVLWFVPGSFPAQAYLALAFLGMTATEFIARAAYRPAYLAHASFSLLPLVAMLLMAGGGFAELTAVLVLFFGGVLYSYCDGFAQLIDEGTLLRFHNAQLIKSLSREKAEAEKARDEAQASTKAKSFFISNISHEIRTPLNALLGMAQLLEQSPLEHAQRNHLRVILEAGRGLKMLLEDVIALSREDYDESSGLNECDADNAVRTVVRLLQPRAWEKKLRLNVTAATNLPPVVGDPRRVRQVLLKLIENALKFTETGGVDISIGTETGDAGRKFVRFSVADTGHGIPETVEKNLFEPFAAGDPSYRRRHQGAGLGLAAAKRIVESLGGKIGCVSAPGEGATFWFTLPAPAHAQPLERSEAAEESAPTGLKLLAFSTDRAVREEMMTLLEPFGNRLVFAATSAEAATRAGREAFDGIIVDAAEADTLGAIPGLKAPILALMTDGQRAPVCAQQIVHWPARADALYAALKEMTGQTGAGAPGPEAAKSAPPSIDPGEFAALEKSLGLPTLIEILQSYIVTAENLCAALNRASTQEHWDEAAKLAQDVAGAAGGLGLSALTAVARNLAQEAREGAEPAVLQRAAVEIIEEHGRVRRALTNLYPELAA